MMSSFFLGAVTLAILVVLIMALSQLSKLGQSLDRLSTSVQKIEAAVGHPGEEPDWPHFNEVGLLDEKPPKATDHKNVSELQRGAYCAQAYTVMLLDRLNSRLAPK